jgi:hypothetical protein
MRLREVRSSRAGSPPCWRSSTSFSTKVTRLLAARTGCMSRRSQDIQRHRLVTHCRTLCAAGSPRALADHRPQSRRCRRHVRGRRGRTGDRRSPPPGARIEELPSLAGLTQWANLMLRPPPPHVLEFVGAMSQHQAVCDEFTQNFNAPERQWETLATPERTQAFLKSRLAGGGS